MKPLTKNILIGLSVAITIVLVLLVILFVIVYAMLVIERNEEHRKLGHCVPLIDSALEMENDFNMTDGFLKSPTVYKELADKCEEAIKCVGVVDSFISADVLHTFASCQFHVFYNREFAPCATKLINKKETDAECLSPVFNGQKDSKLSLCEQWINLQDCLKTQIRITCGGDRTKRYEEMTRRLEDSLKKINKTTRFLRPPSEYKGVVDLCEKAETCFTKITCEDGHDFVADVMDTFPACEFYKFYTGNFSQCAEKLMSQTSNSTCLDTLFNAKHMIRFNRCQQWIDIQPCIYDAIHNECDSENNSTQLVTRYSEVSRDLYRAMNCDPKPQRINTNDIDYEIIGLVGQ